MIAKVIKQLPKGISPYDIINVISIDIGSIPNAELRREDHIGSGILPDKHHIQYIISIEDVETIVSNSFFEKVYNLPGMERFIENEIHYKYYFGKDIKIVKKSSGILVAYCEKEYPFNEEGDYLNADYEHYASWGLPDRS